MLENAFDKTHHKIIFSGLKGGLCLGLGMGEVKSSGSNWKNKEEFFIYLKKK